MNSLLTHSATRLAQLIAQKEVSAREVVDAHIAHIERVNPVVNALVQDRFEEARREADLADRQVEEGRPLPPLHGVPCTIKESFQLCGMRQTAGLVARKAHVASCDAITVARLRAAGAIPLGVTNVPELCMWMETKNRIYGRTNNPYCPSRIVGGSSGGEGAIVGAGGSPFGLGADIGGSIRMPAFFNGVFGHKPSSGLVPSEGQYPFPDPDAVRFLSTGPIARRAEDLPLLVSILAGRPLATPPTLSLRGRRVLSVEDNGVIPVCAELRQAQRRAADHLAQLGARVAEVKIPGLTRSLDIWAASLSHNSRTPFSQLLGNGERVPLLKELVRWSLGRSPHTLPALALAALETTPWLSRARIAELFETGQRLRAQLDALIGPDGVLLFPSYPKVAPRHSEPLLSPFAWVYTGIFSVLELPVTQTPLGLNDEGLPLGVQVVGAHGQDAWTMAVGRELERAFGGWVMPPAFAQTPRLRPRIRLWA